MDNKYYKISEVVKIVDVPASTLRYWEKEFKQLKPHKTSGGQRLYSASSLEFIQTLKSILHDKQLTIEGAKKLLKSKRNDDENILSLSNEEIKAEILDIINILK